MKPSKAPAATSPQMRYHSHHRLYWHQPPTSHCQDLAEAVRIAVAVAINATFILLL